MLSLAHGSVSRATADGVRAVAVALQRGVASWATLDVNNINKGNPAKVYNLVNGEWSMPKNTRTIPDPLNGDPMVIAADTKSAETAPFIKSLKAVPKTGLHNPLKNVERYNMLGLVTHKVAAEMRRPEVNDFFARLIQRTSPKSYTQAATEVLVTTRFLENFGGDQVRFLARGFTVSGDHLGQQSHGVRWPYGPVAIIAPFNFPLEIPVLQLMGALYMGNKPLLHVDQRVSMVMDQFMRLLHECGLPKTDVDVLNCQGPVMNEVLVKAKPHMTLFTGSSRIAEKLALDLSGKVKLEDAGFDWKILGPDADKADVDNVVYVCDQDAYACSGQKCSAQSILFVHENWKNTGLIEKMKAKAATRNLKELTIGPVITQTTEQMLGHVQNLLKIKGAKVLFGGKELKKHTIPKVYGAIEPTAVYVPLDEMLKPEHFDTVTTEIFGPFQIVTEYKASEEHKVIEACERMHAHLTAAVVSNDMHFLHRILGNTVNGTTYYGLRARTTGAPQNHWFGPAGDPRGAGIGTPEAIRLVWSCHRELISDFGPVPANFNYKQT